METNNLEGTLVTQQFLEQVISGVKPLLNPHGITLNTSGYLFKVGLNSYLTDITYPLYINANGLGQEENSHLQFTGQLMLSSTDQLVGLNSGSIRIDKIAYSNTNPLNLYFILDKYITSFSVEILSSTYKENLVSTIEVKNPDDIQQYLDNEGATILEVIEDSTFDGYVFKYIDKTGESHIIPQWYIPVEGETITTIDSIKEADKADRAIVAENLDQNVTVNIVSDPNSLITMTGTGVIESNLGESILTINATNINLPEQEIPLASTTKRGGVKLYGSEDPGYNNFPIQLNNERAYVHVPIGDMDIHRYKNLEAVPSPKVGDIIQYIGNTKNDRINGYFYQYWPTSFIVDPIPSDSTWYALTGMSDIIKTYNSTINYSLVPEIGINISLVDKVNSESEEEVLFAVSQGAYIEYMTYEEIQQNIGIQLKNGYTVQNATDLTIYWRIAPNSDSIWVQKNVQPIMQMQSALVYKGTCIWDELQAKTSTAQPGDFYTVTDKSYQEYFFTKEGTWEFMGDVFTANGKYQVKTKVGSANTVTVSEFEANQSDTSAVTLIQGDNITLTPDTTNHTIEISSTDTQADWNETNTSSPAYINNKPTIPAAQVQTDWNASTGMGVLLNKPSLDFLPLAGGTLMGQVYYNESGTSTTAVACTKKYNFLTQTANTTTLTITAPSSLEGPCEVIYAVKNGNASGGSNITLTLPTSMTGGTVHNMTGEESFTIAPQKIAELVFTFWSTTEVSFNGGVEL